MSPNQDRRQRDRRFTDVEIEEILEYSRGYVNGQKKRQRILGVSLSALLGLTTLINYYIVSPLKEDITTLRHEMAELERNVRDHHENQAERYVLKEDEKAVLEMIRTLGLKMDSMVQYHLDMAARTKK